MLLVCLVAAIAWFVYDLHGRRPKRAFAVSYCVAGVALLLGHWGY